MSCEENRNIHLEQYTFSVVGFTAFWVGCEYMGLVLSATRCNEIGSYADYEISKHFYTKPLPCQNAATQYFTNEVTMLQSEYMALCGSTAP